MHPKGPLAAAQHSLGAAWGVLLQEPLTVLVTFDPSRSSVLLCYLYPGGCSWGLGLLSGSLTPSCHEPRGPPLLRTLVLPWSTCVCVGTTAPWNPCPPRLCLCTCSSPVPAHPQLSLCLPISIS